MKIRKLIALVLTLVIAVSVLGVSALADGDPTFRGGTVTAKAGDTITFPVYIENNPGIAGYMVLVDFSPEAFDLEEQASDEFQNTIEIKLGDFTNEGNVVSNTTKYGAVALYFNVNEVNTDGTIFTVTLNVKKDAVNGEHAVKIRYAANNTVDGDLNRIAFETIDGSVTVTGGTEGTINNDEVGPSAEELQQMAEGTLSESGNTAEETEAIQQQFREQAVADAQNSANNGNSDGNGRGVSSTVGGMKISHLILIIVAILVVIAAVLIVVLRAAAKKRDGGDDDPDGIDGNGAADAEDAELGINEVMGWDDNSDPDTDYDDDYDDDDIDD